MKSGFSVIELLIGTALLAGIVAASTYALQPVAMANKRFRLTTKAHRLEDEIRRGIYYQANYQVVGGFSVFLGNVELARQNQTLYLKEDLSASSPNPIPPQDYPLKTQIALVPSPAMPSGWALAYQVSAVDQRVGMATLGTANWPSDVGNYVATNVTTDYSIVQVPQDLATSVAQKCTAGIMRGVQKSPTGAWTQVCWEYKTLASTPDWAIPTGYTLDGTSNKIELVYSSLNKPQCPGMSITNTISNRTWMLPNFYAFATLDLRDLFPKRAPGAALASQCEKVIDFNKNGTDGLLPQSVVADAQLNSKPGFCPDKNLYTLQADGSCTPTFKLEDIPERKPATAAP